MSVLVFLIKLLFVSNRSKWDELAEEFGIDTRENKYEEEKIVSIDDL